MPLYEYRCTKCGHQFEHIQTYRAPDLKDCPVCMGVLERLISAPALRFSGSGFYETDYKNKPKSGESTTAPGASDGSSSPATDSSTAKVTTPATAAAAPSNTSSSTSPQSSDNKS